LLIVPYLSSTDTRFAFEAQESGYLSLSSAHHWHSTLLYHP
jgi:hypothetical protein